MHRNDVIIAWSVGLVTCCLVITAITIVAVKSGSKSPSSDTLQETFQLAGNNGHPATVICPHQIVPTVIHFKTVNDYVVKCSNKTIKKDGKTEFEVSVEITYDDHLKVFKQVGNYMLYENGGVQEVRPLNEFELREILAEYIHKDELLKEQERLNVTPPLPVKTNEPGLPTSVKPREPTGYFIKKDFPSILSYTPPKFIFSSSIILMRTDYEFTTETFVFKSPRFWNPVYTRLIIHQPGFHTVFMKDDELHYRTMTLEEFNTIKGQEKEEVVKEITAELLKRGVPMPQ